MRARNLILGLLLGIALTVYLEWRQHAIPVAMQPIGQPTVAESPVQANIQKVSVKASSPLVVADPLSSKPNLAKPVSTVNAQPAVATRQTFRQTDTSKRTFTRLLQESIQPASIQIATANQLARFETLVVQSLLQNWQGTNPVDANSIDAKLIQRWNADGWDVNQCGDENDILVIAEMPNHRRGRGIYAIRLGSSSKIYLQAPHRFYDSKSGVITHKLFDEQSVRAAAWNSVHRREIDLSHTNNHFINSFTRAIVTVAPDAIVAQIHGFGAAKQAAITGEVHAIISNGTRFPDRFAIAAAAELKQSLGDRTVRLFPTEVELLGGTRNKQGSLMRNLGSAGFLHIELDSKYREQLSIEAGKRAAFFRSLTKTMQISDRNH